MARIILEGMDPDNTRINYIASEADIPPGAGRIKTTWGRYLLPLVRTVPDALPQGTLEATLETTPIGLFERVTTVLVEHYDGIRVYSDDGDALRKLCDPTRFHRVMEDIFGNNGTFDNAYKQIIADPGRFYSGAIEIVQTSKGSAIAFVPPKKASPYRSDA